MDMVHDFLTSMYTNRADFVFTVSRDFVRSIRTPLLVARDDVPAHPYKVAMEVASLAPNAEVTIYPGKIRRRTSTSRGARAALPQGARTCHSRTLNGLQETLRRVPGTRWHPSQRATACHSSPDAGAYPAAEDHTEPSARANVIVLGERPAARGAAMAECRRG